MKKSRQQYYQAAQKFTASLIGDDEVEGIILVGSIVQGKIHKNSDVDVYIILNDSTTYRERGNILIDDVEIEYFKNPPIQIRAYFEQEKKTHTQRIC